MTPYAVLLAHPEINDDAAVRRRFHALVVAEGVHPDSSGVEGVASQRWFELNAAYKAVKSRAARDTWLRRQLLLSRLCPGCAGLGVLLHRGVAAVCPECKGEGRTAKGL